MASDPAWLTIDCEGERRHVRPDLKVTTLGRNEANVIDLPDKRLSRFHCEIERKGEDYFLRDCDSRNGTKLNGTRLKGTAALGQGDAIEIGATLLLFRTDRPIDADPGNRLVPIAPIPKSVGRATTKRASIDLTGATPDEGFDPRPTIPIPVSAAPPPPPPRPPTRGLRKEAGRVLADAIGALAEATTSEQVVARLAQAALDLVPARQASVLLPAGQGAAARVAAVKASGGQEGPVDARYSSAVVDEVFLTELPVSIQDLKQDPRWGIDYSVLGLDLRGALAVPLRALGGTRGVLYVDEPRAILPEERDEALLLLGALARTAAATLVAAGGSLAVDETGATLDASRVARVAAEVLPRERGIELALKIRAGHGAFAEAQALPEREGRRELALLVAMASGSTLEVLRLEVAARSAFRALVLAGTRGETLLSGLAKALAPDLEGRALKAAVIRLDPATGELRVALAGLGPLVHRSASGEAIALDAPTLALGATLSPGSAEHAIAWVAGELVLLAAPSPADLAFASWLAPSSGGGAAVLVERAFAALPEGAVFLALTRG